MMLKPVCMSLAFLVFCASCSSPTEACVDEIEELAEIAVVRADTGEPLASQFEVTATMNGESLSGLIFFDDMGFSLLPPREPRETDVDVTLIVSADGFQTAGREFSVRFGQCGAATVQMTIELVSAAETYLGSPAR